MGPYELTLVLYGLAFAAYSGLIFVKGGKSGWLPPLISRLGWVAHSYALLARWSDAGLAHGPWVGPYETLLFFSWAVMTAQLLAELRLHLRWTGVFATGLATALLGIACSSHRLGVIEPLTPMMRSSWAWVHLTTGALGSGFFLLGSFLGAFFLLKETVVPEAVLASFSAVAVVGLGGGFSTITALFSSLQAPEALQVREWLAAVWSSFAIHLGLAVFSIRLDDFCERKKKG